MPKSPLDNIAVLVMLASFFLSSFLLKAARRDFTDTQRAVLRKEWFDPVVIGASLGIIAAYFYAPLYPGVALGAAIVLDALTLFRLGRHHISKGYAQKTFWLLMGGIGLQTLGFTVAVGIRALA